MDYLINMWMMFMGITCANSTLLIIAQPDVVVYVPFNIELQTTGLEDIKEIHEIRTRVVKADTDDDAEYHIVNAIFKTSRLGLGISHGYFLQKPNEDIRLKFISKHGNVTTNRITVTTDLYVAYFRPRTSERILNDKIETFLRYNVERLNKGISGGYPFQRIMSKYTFKFRTYHYNEGDTRTAIQQYNVMKNKPERVAFIIGLNSGLITLSVVPIMMNGSYAVTSHHKDNIVQHSRKQYPYFNRLDIPLDRFLDNSFIYFSTQRWTSLVIISTTSDQFSGVVWEEWESKHKIDTMRYTIRGSLGKGEEVNLAKLFSTIRSNGRRIIVTTATGNSAINLFREADNHGITSKQGFQWVGLNNHDSLAFLSRNTEPWCIKKVNGILELCGETFKGMITISGIHYTSFNNSEGELMWRLGLHREDPLKSIIQTTFPEEYELTKYSEYSLAYDALKVNLKSLSLLEYLNKPFRGPLIAEQIRNFKGEVGFSANVEFDERGDRLGFNGLVHVLWPMRRHNPINLLEEHIQWILRGQDDWLNAVIFDMNGETPVFREVWSSYMADVERKDQNLAEAATHGLHLCQIPEEYWNKKDLSSALYPRSMNRVEGATWCTGPLREMDLLLAIDDPYRNPLGFPVAHSGSMDYYPKMSYTCEKVERIMRKIPPFFCEQGCGGGVNESDVALYANGVCKQHGVCECKNGWSGTDCSTPLCVVNECSHGKCVAPDTCKCEFGYTGHSCEKPRCSHCGQTTNCSSCDEFTRNSCTFQAPNKCLIGGECIVPGICKCDDEFYSDNCNLRCTCNFQNAHGCNKINGHCTECKSGYFSAQNDCQQNLYVIFGSSIPGMFLLIGCTYFVVNMCMKWQRARAKLMSNDWILNWDDIHVGDKTGSQKSSMMISAISMNMNMKNPLNSAKIHFNVGTWDGISVYYQIISKTSINITKAIREEMTKIREIRHENICALIGCTLEQPNICIITELQPKGSVEDLLSNEDIKLTWSFKFGLMKGICAGLEFISTSPIKVHNRLKSSNCLVDNRWSLKLSGFGLDNFKSNAESTRQPNHASLLWTAPEVIRDNKADNLYSIVRGTFLNDIYAFGIIISEFCTRDWPFAEVMLEKDELVHLICGEENTEGARAMWDEYLTEHNREAGGAVRPLIMDDQWPERYEVRKLLKTLMESCWDENTNNRPSIRHCRKALDQMNPRKGELIDNILATLDMYSNDLENMITKRTLLLEKESQRTDDLVSRLLPKSVVDDLKQGKDVKPECFDYVTIYFSDIVGFTSIARASTPFEVVALLNNMYTVFDSISEMRDVYKVETIGDAYMIVSGLPERNGDLHAGEICTTALKLMSAIGSFVVPHLPDTKLRLRSGVHTGSVVAGIVGLKMPRYCLFGDSVNIASSMESGGEPSRIQISGETRKVLDRLSGYHCEYRHDVTTAKLGDLSTYWLNGKDGFTDAMPEFGDEE